MSEWIQCRICGNVWDCLVPHWPFNTCVKCSNWTDEEKKAGREYQDKLRDKMYSKLDKISKGIGKK